MWRRPFTFALYLCVVLPAALLLAAFQPGTSTQTIVLYDGRLGGTPDDQEFSFLSYGSLATELDAAGVTVLDTTGDISEQAGYFSRSVLSLDRHAGFTLQFAIQLGEEEHLGPNRAGLSVILLSDDLLGVEMGFWENEVWVQEGGTGDSLFTHAEGAAVDTTADLVTYQLAVQDSSYTLSADGQPILTGPLRDYTAFEGFPDVYESPGLLFLGDNTRRAAAKTAVSLVALVTIVSSTETPLATATTEPSATPTLAPPRTATATPTLEPTASLVPTVTPTAQPTSAPGPADMLYLWMSCLKGVDIDSQK